MCVCKPQLGHNACLAMKGLAVVSANAHGATCHSFCGLTIPPTLFLPFTKPLRHVFTRWATLRSFRGCTLKAKQVWLTKRSHNSCACFQHPPLSMARATWYVGCWRAVGSRRVAHFPSHVSQHVNICQRRPLQRCRKHAGLFPAPTTRTGDRCTTRLVSLSLSLYVRSKR